MENQIYEEKTNSCINISNKFESDKITNNLENNNSTDDLNNISNNSNKNDDTSKTDNNNTDGLAKSSEEIGEKKNDQKNNDGISKTSEEDKNIAENIKIHILNLLFAIINLF